MASIGTNGSANGVVHESMIGLPISGESQEALAPPPVIDRMPIVIGPGISLAYISAIFRLSTTGFRQTYVDLLDEMLEKDPHAYSVVSKRVLGVANARVEIVGATVEPNSQDEKRAEEIRAAWEKQIHCIPDFEQHIAALAWGVFYGISATETHWGRDGAGWMIDRLSFVHSRRLSYPVPGTWDLCVWDQGQVASLFQAAPTNGLYGLRIKDYPGKFLVHAPQVRGDYPTREGIGRQIAYWMALKLIAARGAPKYLERFASPWPEATYATDKDKDKRGRAASKEDIAQARDALKAMGAGSLASWVHADTVELELKTADVGRAKITFGEWINICNSEISKAVLGGTLTTEVGTTGGNRSLGETQKKGETTLLKQDAKLLGAAIDRYLTHWWVRLNFGDDAARLAPATVLHVEDDPDPMLIVERAAKASAHNVPVDADWLADETGLKLVDPEDPKARRMFPIQAVKEPEVFDRDFASRSRQVSEEFVPDEANPAAPLLPENEAGLDEQDGTGSAEDEQQGPDEGGGDD